ncbi:hypothetical protein BKA62DRAFT_772949 [Auriculariales sp. MPI-PUGE-AT-0066]|nr:hypothetical protein BKA62DRAFT_772949 [Auriculariales sp. MPI-PUGE-AT-0066]
MRRLALLFALVSVVVGVPALSTDHDHVGNDAENASNGAYSRDAHEPSFVAVERGYDPEHDCKGSLCTEAVTTIEYRDVDDTARGGPLAGGDMVTPAEYRERDDLDSNGEATGEGVTAIVRSMVKAPTSKKDVLEEALPPHDGRMIEERYLEREFDESIDSAATVGQGGANRGKLDEVDGVVKRDYDRQRHAEGDTNVGSSFGLERDAVAAERDIVDNDLGPDNRVRSVLGGGDLRRTKDKDVFVHWSRDNSKRSIDTGGDGGEVRQGGDSGGPWRRSDEGSVNPGGDGGDIRRSTPPGFNVGERRGITVGGCVVDGRQ